MPKAFTQDQVVSLIEEESGYTVSNINYKNQKSKILIRHDVCGNIFSMDITHWKDRGQRCPFCSKAAQRKTHEKFLEDVEKYQPGKYTIIGKYVNKRTKVEIMCNKCGCKTYMLPCNIFSGRCGNCRNIANSTKYRKNIDEVNMSLPKGYVVIGKYINNKTPVLIRHSCGCEFLATVTNISLKRKSQKCPKCFANKSSGEDNLFKFISKNVIDSTQSYRHRDAINKHKFKELDILSSNKIGIEFNGLYWHSTDRRSEHNLLEKTEFFKSHDIQVLHIFEDEWDKDQDNIKSRLSDILLNNIQYIQDPNNPDQLIPFTNEIQSNRIVIDRRWFITDKDILAAGYRLTETLPPKEFFLTNSCDIRYTKKSDDTKFSIFDCGYFVYEK